MGSYQIPEDLARQTAELVGCGVAEKAMDHVKAKAGVDLAGVTPQACQFWAQWTTGEGGRGTHLKVLELQVVVRLPRRSGGEVPFHGVAVTVGTWGPGDFFCGNMLERHQLDSVEKLAGPKPVLLVQS